MEAGFDNGVGQVVVRFFFAGLDDLEAADEATAGVMADHIRMSGLNFAQTSFEDLAQTRCVAGQIFGDDFLQVRESGGTADGIAGMGAGHRAGWKLVHDVGAADDC